MALPGEIRRLDVQISDEGCYHEGCSQRPTHSYCSEADSMGAEYEYYCERHIEGVREQLKEQGPEMGYCSGCGKFGELKPARAWDEGNNGPVHDWCGPCRQENADDAQDALDDLQDAEAHEAVDEILQEQEPQRRFHCIEREYRQSGWLSVKELDEFKPYALEVVEISSISKSQHDGWIFINGIVSWPVGATTLTTRLNLATGQLTILPGIGDIFDEFWDVWQLVRKIRTYGYPISFIKRVEEFS